VISGYVQLISLDVTAVPHGVYGTFSHEVLPRSLPDAPDGYSPQDQTCPATRPSIRSAAQLSTAENNWLPTRRNATISAMRDFFGRVTVANFDAVSYINSHANNISALPNIAISLSGGGYRAMTNGAGAIKAFDSRTGNSTGAGQLGGILQSATYVSGLSGGSWLLGSIYMNNFSTISNLQTEQPGSVWELENSIFEGPSDTGGFHFLGAADYWTDLIEAVASKDDAGFPISLTDYWYVSSSLFLFGSQKAYILSNGFQGTRTFLPDDQRFRGWYRLSLVLHCSVRKFPEW
jgi:lysophospholipase